MKINPYLSINGNCDAAFKFYELCTGGKILFKMTYGDSPMAAQTRHEPRNRIMHVALQVGNCQLQGADAPPPYLFPAAGL